MEEKYNGCLHREATNLRKEIGVVEILEDIEPDDELIEAIKTIGSQGYTLGRIRDTEALRRFDRVGK